MIQWHFSGVCVCVDKETNHCVDSNQCSCPKSIPLKSLRLVWKWNNYLELAIRNVLKQSVKECQWWLSILQWVTWWKHTIQKWWRDIRFHSVYFLSTRIIFPIPTSHFWVFVRSVAIASGWTVIDVPPSEKLFHLILKRIKIIIEFQSEKSVCNTFSVVIDFDVETCTLHIFQIYFFFGLLFISYPPACVRFIQWWKHN